MKTRRKTERLLKDNLWGWFFILPTFTGLIILNIIPILQTFWQSFHRVGAFGIGSTFIGLQNYQQMVNDPQVWQALLNTLIYTAVEVPLSIVAGFVFAVILNQKLPGRGAFRTIFFLPMIVAPAAMAMVWGFLFNHSFGLLNHILTAVGLSPVGWLTNRDIAIFSIAFAGAWATFGYVMILFLAGLQEIPQEYYEAADMEGASFLRKQLFITLPLISPTTFFILIIRVMVAMQVFDSIFMMIDRHSPVLHRTQSLVFLFYRFSFMEHNRGYGATVIVLLLALVMIITVIQNFYQKRWVNYG